MAKVIALAGSKGGSGKSTLSHLLAHGAGSLARAIPAAVVTTDPEDRLLEDQRRYLVVDGRTPARLADELERLLPVERPLVVIDGAAARSDLDAVVSRVADLVVVPVRPSPDDLEAVGETLKILRRLDRRAVVVVNAAKNEGRARDARAALSRYPVPVCPAHVVDRAVCLDAALEGRGVGEMRGAAARDAHAELRAVWAWIREVADERE